ncbi:MAG: MBL fold metallo-hydrolase [Phycisphaerales bacterium]|nr:MBL fold metallo-hydrolase [Phycisphaerales bacterium]
MSIEYRIISLGTLSSHPLRHEPAQRRTGHTTTSLITVGERHIIVNPGLPDVALRARLDERSDVGPDDVTDVFLTSFSIEHRRGLSLFSEATVFVHEPERAFAELVIAEKQDEARETGDEAALARFNAEREVLEQCRDAEDSIAQGVDLFPLPGVTPGTCGLLLAMLGKTVLITGDAIPTLEHLTNGQVLNTCADLETAQESFREAIEIADEFILGRDSIVQNPLRQMQGMGRLQV